MTVLFAALAMFAGPRGGSAPKGAEFSIKTDRSVSVERLAASVRPFGKVDARMPGSSIFLIHLNPGADEDKVKIRLAAIPGVQPIDAGEQPVDFNSERSLDRKIAALMRDGDKEPKHPRAKGEKEENERVDYLRALKYFIHRRAYPNDTFDPKSIERGRRHAADMKTAILRTPGKGPIAATGSNNWTFVGPTNLAVPYNEYYGISPCNGRVNAVAFDPSNSNTIYAGGAQGGLWKSTNGGQNWTWLSSTWTQLGINCIVIDPNDSDTIYVGRGDYHGYILGSYGIMKSTDGGLTWTEIAESSMGSVGVNHILIDPTNSQTLIAGTGDSSTFTGYLWRSTDAGQTWTQLSVGGQYFIWPTIASSAPNNGSVRFYAVAAGYAISTGQSSRVYKSDDHGQTWQVLSSPVATSSNNYNYAYEVATSPTNPNNVYVLDSEDMALYTSTNQGSTWNNVSGNLPNGDEIEQDYNFSQSWYDYHLECGTWVQGLTNTDVIFLGEIDITESLDGGNSWISIGGPTYDPGGSAVAHNDQHCLAVCPTNPNLAVFSNDGGVYTVSFDSNYNPTVTNCNQYLGNSMFYHIGLHPTNPDIMVGGTQDNATPVAQGDILNWTNVAGGDGGGCAVNQANPLIQYASVYDLDLFSTNDGWNSENNFAWWGNPFTGNAPFVCTMALDPENQYLLYTASNYLYQWNETSQSWNGPLGNQDLTNDNNYPTVDAIAVAPTSSNTIYTGSSDGALFMTTNQGNSWSKLTANNLPGQDIPAVSVSTASSSDILVGFGGDGAGIAHLYRCSNTQAASPSFVAVSGSGSNSLPDASLNAIARDINNPTTTWYVATDVGVFVTTDSGSSWANAGAPLGLPNVIVDDLVSVPGTGYLNAGTYGSGMWQIQIGTVNHPKLTNFTISPTTVAEGGTSTGTVTISAQAPEGGVSVDLASSDTSVATVPSSVVISAGSTSATFTITAASSVSATSTSVISATYNSVTLNQTLTVTPPIPSSVTLAPSTIVGGTQSTGTVTLTGNAPSGGAAVSLSSSSSDATVPSSVTVSAGANSATFTVTTTSVSAQTSATITATLNSASKNATLTITPAALTGLSVSPTSVAGGNPSTGTVTLSGPAGPGGLSVKLSSSSSSATVPASVTVASGASSATFTITTVAVSSTTNASISGTLNGVQESANLSITAATLSSVTVSPTSVLGGNPATGTVTLSGAAGPSGASVTLSSSSSSAKVPASVSVPAGSKSATFAITTVAVNTNTSLTITGTLSGSSKTASLTVDAPAVNALTLSPSTVVGGSPSTGTVTLNGAAGPGGASVALSSSSASVTVPGTVTVPAGATSATFTASTSTVSSNVSATITASLNGGSATASLGVDVPLLASLSITPGSVIGGNSATGTVSLARAAPSGGVSVSLSSSAGASVPASVSIAGGASSASFTVNTTGQSSTLTATVTGTLSGTSKSGTLTITAASFIALTVTSPVVGGNSAVGMAKLNGAAPAAGITVTLSSSSAAAGVPSSVTIVNGASSVQFAVSTKAVTTAVTATIAGTSSVGSQSAPLAIQPAGLENVSLLPSTVVGGSKTAVVGTVSFNGLAASPGDTVTLTSSNTKLASVPASVKVAAGSSSINFTVTHKPVTSTESVMITAKYAGETQTATLTLTPFEIMSLSVNPSSVNGGTSASGQVTLNAEPGPGSGALAVKLSSSSKSVIVPATVSVPLGLLNAEFTIKTDAVSSNTTATLKATYGSSSQQASLTVIAPVLMSVSVSPASVKGSAGTAVKGTVTLSGPAPAGGLKVSLTSSDSAAASVPATVTIAAGATSAKFTVKHTKVSSSTAVTISASLAATTKTTTLTVTP